MQFGVKNARCGAMRAIFDPFSDHFPVGKTSNFSKIYVKKEAFHNHFWHIGNQKAIKQLPTNPTERFLDPFPVVKTGNFSKINVKKEVFLNHFGISATRKP